MGTLLQNILYGVLPDRAFGPDGLLVDPLPDGIELPTSEENMWKLCRVVGLSETLIGETYEPKVWASKHLVKVAPWLPRDDIVQVSLVRALLHRPSLLLLFKVGSDWAIEEQEELKAVIEAFLACNGHIESMVAYLLEGKGREMKQQKGETSSCGVVWSAPDPLLAIWLEEERDLVLSVDSKDRGTLTKFEGTFAQDNIANMKKVREMQVMRNAWDKVKRALPTAEAAPGAPRVAAKEEPKGDAVSEIVEAPGSEAAPEEAQADSGKMEVSEL